MPIRNLSLTNVSIQGQKGMRVRNAEVTMKNVAITPAAGEPIVREEGAKIEGR